MLRLRRLCGMEMKMQMEMEMESEEEEEEGLEFRLDLRIVI